MLHIQLKGMTNTVTCKHIFIPNSPSTPGMGSNVKFFFLKVVMLHINLIGTEHRASTMQHGSKYHIFCSYTPLDTWDGVKRSIVFCCKSNKREWNLEHHAITYSVLTHTLNLRVCFKSKKIILNVVMLQIKGKGVYTTLTNFSMKYLMIC